MKCTHLKNRGWYLMLFSSSHFLLLLCCSSILCFSADAIWTFPSSRYLWDTLNHSFITNDYSAQTLFHWFLGVWKSWTKQQFSLRTERYIWYTSKSSLITQWHERLSISLVHSVFYSKYQVKTGTDPRDGSFTWLVLKQLHFPFFN